MIKDGWQHLEELSLDARNKIRKQNSRNVMNETIYRSLIRIVTDVPTSEIGIWKKGDY